MTKLTSLEIKHLAKLADLNLTDSEIKKYQIQLAQVIEYITEISEVDTTGVTETSRTTDLTNIQRADQVKAENIFTSDQTLSGSENIKNGYFQVQGILDKE